ncbi:MAG: DUF4893 domain-containing protein [Pseudomonadota bacterium]
MKVLVTATALLLSLSGCNVYREATSARPDLTQPWRGIATDADRDRYRDWRKAWTEALPEAQAENGAALAADATLFDPDRALSGAAIPAGKYRCRTFKLGASGTAMRAFTTYPTFDCEISENGEIDSLHKLNGVQRPVGLLFPETDARMIFLGTLILGDETSPLRYGLDARRDMVGYVERIGEARWRLVLPRPHFESKLDIIELVPA